MNNQNNTDTKKSLEKLSSGLRINKAGDNAAGLGISEKMRSQIRGLGQASSNIQDGISLIQTAEGGLQEIHALLQRGRELSVQATNDTNTVQDRTNLQLEATQITKEVDRIAQTTDFNTINLLNVNGALPGASTVLQHLKDSWLAQSVSRIQSQYGIVGDNTNLTVNIVQGTPGGFTAYVSALVNGTPGAGTNLSLNIELADYNATTNTIGGLSADRTIAHEMTHAVMARTMNWSEAVNGTETSGISTWFREGTAELLHGADERLAGDLGTQTPTLAQAQGIVNLIGAAGTAWVSDSAHYSAAYAASRYMDETIRAAGGTGMNEVMAYLSGSTSRTLDQAIAFVGTAHSIAAWTGVSGFKTDFAANGANFIVTSMDLTNADTGAIGNFDDAGGPSQDDTSIISDVISAADPTPFNEIYPNVAASVPLTMQIGSNAGQTLAVALTKADSSSLGIANVDLINGASTAITSFDNAISSVSDARATFGALQNRLEHALNVSNNYNENLTSSESRIRDSDMASEMMSFTKTTILAQASMAMLTQANQQPQNVLQLLRTSA